MIATLRTPGIIASLRKPFIDQPRRPGAGRRLLPAVIWSLVIAALLLSPGDNLPQVALWDRVDKPVHALLFAVHCPLVARALAVPGQPRRGLLGAVLLSGLYAAVLEVAQLGVPGRFWSGWDLVAGWVGIAFAAVFLELWRARLAPPA